MLCTQLIAADIKATHHPFINLTNRGYLLRLNQDKTTKLIVNAHLKPNLVVMRRERHVNITFILIWISAKIPISVHWKGRGN